MSRNNELQDAVKRSLERYFKDLIHKGAHLTEAQRVRLKELNEELSSLQTQFSKNVLADTNDLAVLVVVINVKIPLDYWMLTTYMRAVVPVAMQRSLPALMKASSAGAPTEAACSRPAIRSVTAGAARIKGYTEAEILGANFSCFYTPEDRRNGLPQRALRTAIEEGRFEGEGWRLRKDGTPFWSHVVIDPIRSPEGVLLGFAKITRDLTEKREQEEALRAADSPLAYMIADRGSTSRIWIRTLPRPPACPNTHLAASAK